jgi:hypothetical protein
VGAVVVVAVEDAMVVFMIRTLGHC